jgi:serine/threonine protein phosphatase 1
MATIAIGDIHGNLAALRDLLEKLRGDINDGDVVVFLGDYIDRGPDSRGCIDAILAFRDAIPAEVVCLRGNHEDWLLRTQNDFTHHSWLLVMEALSTIRSYSPDAYQTLHDARKKASLELYLGHRALPYEKFFDAVPMSHREFFSQLALRHETADCICSHAGVDPHVTGCGDQPAASLVWGHSAFPEAYEGERTVVYGHRNNAEIDSNDWPSPRIVGNTIGIDTISHGVLTAIRLPDRRVIQSSRHRE